MYNKRPLKHKYVTHTVVRIRITIEFRISQFPQKAQECRRGVGFGKRYLNGQLIKMRKSNHTKLTSRLCDVCGDCDLAGTRLGN